MASSGSTELYTTTTRINREIVTINRTRDLRYAINITGNGTFSYKISATTIEEGPYKSGDNITIPSLVKSRRNADENSTSPFNRSMIAGFVAGFIVLVLILIVVITSYKRRNRNRKNKHEDIVMDQVPVSLAVIDDTPVPENNDYDDLLKVSAKSSFDTENNLEDHTYEETESSIPDLIMMTAQSPTESLPPESKLTEEFKSIPVEPMHECKMAKRPANKKKNRYKNIVAYDHSLVTLEPVNDDQDSCYINASFIRGYDGAPAAYIATQGPLNNTLDDFWRMIWDHEISSIAMLTNLLELGKRKCHQYWPDKNSARYSDITVTNHKTEVFAYFTIRTFFVSKDGVPKRKVLHFHFTAWPDNGVPLHATAALAFRQKVLAMSSDDNRPVVIHSSAGVGRTGTYIMIDAMLRQAQTEQQTLDIPGYLHAIRDDRPYMVQTLEQYIFVNMAIYEALTCGNTELQAHELRSIMHRLSTVDIRQKRTGYALEFQV
ncbi:receptor-type tyrosine-protein phosphatase kappa-like [Actinia tenebrosa]|uniref:Receptor-type tyrosine-protein phosphatase kappa-like n=1 Tax=Actinia tenebrosa TaxID=6105 RepID=A0A6P8H8W1_ACTTE|nr:receptor-type tyrosine-protein phosphatase kappa-like [Actinia tenebrosa]